MVTAEPMLMGTMIGQRLTLAATGSWTAEHANELEPLVERVTERRLMSGGVSIDMGRIERLDTFGAWLVERLLRAWRTAGYEADIIGLADHYRALLEEVHNVNRGAHLPPPSHRSIFSVIEKVSRAVLNTVGDFIAIVEMWGEAAVSLTRVLRRPTAFRLTSFLYHTQRVGLQAVPIIVLITFLLGCIIAQQGIFHFRGFGAEVYVIDMIAILILRELGVIMVSIIIAARSGSAYTAELGSMKMREEVDALRTMGFAPVDVLVLPRLVALVIVLPILTFIGSMAALCGGGLVCWLYGGISPEIFLSRLKEAVSLNHFFVGMIKAPFMAFMIGIIACAEGLRVKGSAEFLGAHTTASVVKSVFLVIVLDGLFAMFFASIGK